mgnify:CR=1 FL=1
METPIEFSELSFEFVAEGLPGQGAVITVRPLIQGVDVIGGHKSLIVGYYADKFFAQENLLNGGFTILANCSCGFEQCGAEYMWVTREAEYVSWTLFICPSYESRDFYADSSEEELNAYSKVFFKPQDYDAVIAAASKIANCS